GNYIYSILNELVKNTEHQFILYSNKEIFYPDLPNVRKVIHSSTYKGPVWQNTSLIYSLFKDRPDVFWGGNGYLPMLVPKKTKLILTVHDLVYKYAGRTMPTISRLSRRFFQPLSVNKADAIVAVSHATADEVYKEYGVRPDCVVHPQISPLFSLQEKSNLAKIKEKYQLNEYILTIGTLEPRKNMVALIQAYLNVVSLGYKLPVLAIAGGKGWMQGELDKLVEKGVAKGIIRKLGYVSDPDLAVLYSGAQLFVLASIYEGFGMPILEAQASGCPVLISRIKSMIEAAGDICCTFEPDIQSIENSLINLSKGNQPLICRLPYTIENKIDIAAKKYEKLMRLS
ncbi:glycosyltransferase family 4 protein, partial [Escherichia coli]